MYIEAIIKLVEAYIYSFVGTDDALYGLRFLSDRYMFANTKRNAALNLEKAEF